MQMKFYYVKCVDTGEEVFNYQDYLNTKHWNLIKIRYYSKYKKECCLCGGSHYLNLHHLTYKNIGNESLNDLVCLCKDCHRMVHSISVCSNDKYIKKAISCLKSYQNKSNKELLTPKNNSNIRANSKNKVKKKTKNNKKVKKNKQIKKDNIKYIYTANKKKFYAVKHKNGDKFIYDEWKEAVKKINKISGVKHKSFLTEKDAVQWLKELD